MPENNSDEKKVSVLLVEDNPGDVRLIVETLKDGRLGQDIRVAKDGEEALSIIGSGAVNPDLILLDLKLPKKNGLEVLEGVRKNAATRNTPVVVLSSSEASSDVEKAYELKANCYVTKPIDLDRFIVTINAINDFWLTVVRLSK